MLKCLSRKQEIKMDEILYIKNQKECTDWVKHQYIKINSIFININDQKMKF